ncbi:MAG: FMN-binding protein [Anaerohalosphaera sp.]|nr:FMN-binding protein [Anaerohalosphaera sp.]
MQDNKLKFFLKQSWLIIAASFVFGALLAVTQGAWQPRIDANQIAKFNKLASSMIEDANDFQIPQQMAEFTVDMGKGKKLKTEVKLATNAATGETFGWAFIAVGSGFADKIKLVVTTDIKCEKILGYGVLFSNETPGFGDKIKRDDFKQQFVGAPVGQLTLTKIPKKEENKDKDRDKIVAITGATVSSKAVVEIFNNVIPQVKAELESKGLLK